MHNRKKQAYNPVRRIVTGLNSYGQSCILSDGPALNVNADVGHPIAQVLWATGDSRALGDEPAPTGHKFPFHSENGSLLRVVDFPSDESYNQADLVNFLDREGVRDTKNPRHFWFHKTESLDYAVVLDGEIYAMLDEGETLMKSGDVLIQRATNHSWSNRSGANCRMLFVLLALREGQIL